MSGFGSWISQPEQKRILLHRIKTGIIFALAISVAMKILEYWLRMNFLGRSDFASETEGYTAMAGAIFLAAPGAILIGTLCGALVGLYTAGARSLLADKEKRPPL